MPPPRPDDQLASAAQALTAPFVATLNITSQWGNGYCAEVTVQNVAATPISTWSVSADLNGTDPYTEWSATFSRTDSSYTATPASWNAHLDPGAMTVFGFCGASDNPGTLPFITGVGGEPIVPVDQRWDSVELSLPAGIRLDSLGVLASESVVVSDRARVVEPDETPGRVVNTGSGVLTVGVGALVGDSWTGGTVDLRPYATVDGVLRAASTVHFEPGAEVTGALFERTPLGPLESFAWQPDVVSEVGHEISLEPETTRTLQPGRYLNVSVKRDAILSLGSGTYRFSSLNLGADSILSLTASQEPTILLVDGGFVFQGRIEDQNNPGNPNLPLLIATQSSGTVSIERPFLGTLLAPHAKIVVSPGVHDGAFVGKDVHLSPDAVVRRRGFPWPSPSDPGVNPDTSWHDSPVSLVSCVDATGTSEPDEISLDTPTAFTIPTQLLVSTGNAGQGEAQLRFMTESGAQTTCTYRGRASVAHPTSDVERMLGRRYRFVSCNDGKTAGMGAVGKWFELRVLGGDAGVAAGRTCVELALGDGCSGTIPSVIDPAMVAQLREAFDWESVNALPVYDPSGNPALWHGLIYVENKAQLAALDRLHIMWSAQPLLKTFRDQMAGKCGVVEHASDGRGVAVFAVFPAFIFDVMQIFARQAKQVGKEPPFRFMIPMPPLDPSATNSDGSLSYQSLVDSGYREWLEVSRSQQPFIGAVIDGFEDLRDGVDDLIGGPWGVNPGDIERDLIDMLIPDELEEQGEDWLEYGSSTFEAMIDWAVVAGDDLWEWAQEALHSLARLVCDDTVDLDLTFRVLNRDRMFRPYDNAARPVLTRLWGPPGAPDMLPQQSQDRRPFLVPSGASVMLRQWGCGFLPVMTADTLPEDGQVRLEPLQDADGRGEEGDICIELQTDYAMMTTDLIPLEVCKFNSYDYWTYQSDEESVVAIDQEDIFAFTQIKDSSDYVTQRIGVEPYRMEVLTGWIANDVTTAMAGEPRAMCLCLDFPSMGARELRDAAAIAGATVGGIPVVNVVASLTSTFGPVVLGKDLWWPRANRVAAQSRGVMTHEYGHFNMCQLMYEAEGPSGLKGLLARVFDGETEHSYVAQMTETIADSFALQVVGGTNYTPYTPGAVWQDSSGRFGGMGFCTASPCIDYNYAPGDYHAWFKRLFPNEDMSLFNDRIAVWTSLVYDAFDVAPLLSRDALGTVNADVLQRKQISGHSDWSYLGYSDTGYLSSNIDENVGLARSLWLDWMQNYLDRGAEPDIDNVMGGLADTMRETGHSWCEVCDVFAAHDLATPLDARMLDPTFDPANPTGTLLTLGRRKTRWNTCIDTPRLRALVGEPPNERGNINSSCQSCPEGSAAYDDSQPGWCVWCPPGTVARNNTCVPCSPGQIASDNECVDCGPGTISANGVCVRCPEHYGPDRQTNTCVPCPMDAIVDWSQLSSGCEQQAQFFLDATGLIAWPEPQTDDICPGEFWLQVDNVRAVAGTGFFAALMQLNDTAQQFDPFIDVLPWNPEQTAEYCQLFQYSIDVFEPTGQDSTWQLTQHLGRSATWDQAWYDGCSNATGGFCHRSACDMSLRGSTLLANLAPSTTSLRFHPRVWTDFLPHWSFPGVFGLRANQYSWEQWPTLCDRLR